MSMSADQIIDRRRLRRKLSFWRGAAFLVLAGLVFAMAGALGLHERFGVRGSDHIARVKITGTITNQRNLLELFRDLGEKSRPNKNKDQGAPAQAG